MKQNKAKLYAKVLAEIISKMDEGKKDLPAGRQVVNNFVKLLVSSGYEKKSKEILELTENLLLRKQGKRKITFETARKITPGQKKILDSIVNKGDVVKEKINPELIAGIKIIINDERQFDTTMANRLDNLLYETH